MTDGVPGHVVPGHISHIFLAICPVADRKQHMFAQNWFFFIYRFRTLDGIDKLKNPFKNYLDFDILLWLDTYMDVSDIIVADQNICHAISCKWMENVVAMKPLN